MKIVTNGKDGKIIKNIEAKLQDNRKSTVLQKFTAEKKRNTRKPQVRAAPGSQPRREKLQEQSIGGSPFGLPPMRFLFIFYVICLTSFCGALRE